MAMIEINGARFRMGLSAADREALQQRYPNDPHPFHREAPDHPIELRPYLIEATPVTNEAFAAFVKDDGYARDAHWGALLEERGADAAQLRQRFVDQEGRPGPLSWKDGTFAAGEGRHPVSGVSWYEASAYAHWRGLRLPIEAEWEYAARGDDGRWYPWGMEFDPERCTHRGRPEHTTVPVDAMPQGKSPFGLLHCSGNVAEWVADSYAAYPGTSGAESLGPHQRVLRNDFYLGTAMTLRTTVRTPQRADARARGFGFRCAQDLKLKAPTRP
jgi:iron(II)-dependent oxidoreductase